MSVTVLVPMRAGSKRVPGKNWRPLAGRPLFEWVLDELAHAKCISKVIVDSDSHELLDLVRSSYPKVICRLRPAHLGGDQTSMNAVIRDVLASVEGNWFLQTHVTNPFLKASTIDAAWQALAGSPTHDSLFTTIAQRKRYWTAEGKPVNHDPNQLLPTQDLKPMHEENSCIYLFSRASFLVRGNRIGERPLLHAMEPMESVDIDTESDWRLAEAIARLQGGPR